MMRRCAGSRLSLPIFSGATVVPFMSSIQPAGLPVSAVSLDCMSFRFAADISPNPSTGGGLITNTVPAEGGSSNTFHPGGDSSLPSQEELATKPGVPEFGSDGVYSSSSFIALLRSILVFRMCRSPFLVTYGPPLLKKAAAVFGDYLAYETVCKWTMFNHFCAGTDDKTIIPALRKLEKLKVGAILDYAAEAEVPLFTHQSALKPDLDMKSLIKRLDLKYADETEYDENLKIFLRCIDHARADFPREKTCFSAVKFTGLVDPQLLARIASLMLSLRQLWVRLFTPDKAPPHLEDCRVVIGVHTDSRFSSKEKITAGVSRLLEGSGKSRAEIEKTAHDFHAFLNAFGKSTGADQKPGTAHEHDVDYLVFSHVMCTALYSGNVAPELQPLVDQLPALSEEEIALISRFKDRCKKIMDRAVEKNVFVMVDAEQTFYQMAIDHFVRAMQRIYNKDVERPFVYNTYQCYLKIAEARLDNDLQRADREGWKWAGKMVRGAYVEQEAKTAAEYHYENPIQPDIQATHACYNRCAMKLVDRLADKKKERIGVLFGTHNMYTLQLITSRITEKVPDANERKSLDLAFGQLYGMTDYLTQPLAKSGYKAFKYVPYGPVKETVEYLSRRAQENGAIAGSTLVDTRLLWREIRSRPAFTALIVAVATILNILCYVYWPEDPNKPSMLTPEELGFTKDGKRPSMVTVKNPGS